MLINNHNKHENYFLFLVETLIYKLSVGFFDYSIDSI